MSDLMEPALDDAFHLRAIVIARAGFCDEAIRAEYVTSVGGRLVTRSCQDDDWGRTQARVAAQPFDDMQSAMPGMTQFQQYELGG